MNVNQIRENVAKTAASYVGVREGTAAHRNIVDTYNTIRPLPVGYRLKYNDAWCAGFVSFIAVKLGYTDIIPCECGCPRMIKLMQKKGIWVESDNYVPKPGDIIFYDWDDNASGDNTGTSDHVGIVEKVSGNTITVIEGNYSNSVKRRNIAVNGKYIRGYGVPNYASKATKDETPKVETNTTPATKPTTSNKKTIEQVAREVMQGKYGNGAVRKRKIEAEGYNYAEVQAAVNALLTGKPVTTTPKKSIEQIAMEVIQGKWGNGATRKRKIEEAGYDYAAVQKKVNELL